MTDYWIRPATSDDAGEIAALNRSAFGGTEEGEIVLRLVQDGDSLASLIAHDDRRIAGHIQFFRVLIDGQDEAAGLGPMSVLPDMQRRGIGSGLVRFGMRLIEGMGRTSLFVLGHPDYYSRFGFDAGAAKGFSAPWTGPAFMAIHFTKPAPRGGELGYPGAFGD